MASIFKPECRANVAVLDKTEVSVCYSLNWYILGGITIGTLILLIAYKMSRRAISIGSGLLIIVGLITILIGFGYISALAGRQVKESQDFEYKRLVEKKLSPSEALQAIYLEGTRAKIA